MAVDWTHILFPASPPSRSSARQTPGPYTPHPVQTGWETGVDPTLVAKAQQLKALAAQEGIDLAITAGHRSKEEQARLYAQGRTTPGDIITYAKPGQSRHESGRAIDVVPLKDGKPDWRSPHWSRLGALGHQLGLEWGGTWKKLTDRPHFQLPTGGTPVRQAADTAPARDWGAVLFATSPATGGAATRTSTPSSAPAGTIPGVETLTPTFRTQVQQVARRLRMDPQHLLTVMSFETGGTFDPAVKNRAGSGATGLIQFMPSTAKSLGTSTEALAGMTPEQQLDYVERYLKPYAGRMRTQQDAYLAVLNPSAMGKPASHVLFTQGTRAYELNKALDKEGKGQVTVGDTVASVGRFTGTRGQAAVAGTDWGSVLFATPPRGATAAPAPTAIRDWSQELFATPTPGPAVAPVSQGSLRASQGPATGSSPVQAPYRDPAPLAWAGEIRLAGGEDAPTEARASTDWGQVLGLT